MASMLAILVFVMAFTEAKATCAYAAIHPEHTMCKTDVGTAIVITDAEKQAALDQHNTIRKNVDAKVMMKLVNVLVSSSWHNYETTSVDRVSSPLQKDWVVCLSNITITEISTWDDELAAVAAKWAIVCDPVHNHEPDNKMRQLLSLPGVGVGQNWARPLNSLQQAIAVWESEIDNFTYGEDNLLDHVGHYTQIVYGTTSRVGCGAATCAQGKTWVCNYAHGQMTGATKYPYAAGVACSGCVNKCYADKLCDCDGKICMQGNLNATDCSCQCNMGYQGDLCDAKNCSGSDDDGYCDLLFNAYPNACNFDNVKKEDCRFRCGFC